jgi:hypothetical protein
MDSKPDLVDSSSQRGHSPVVFANGAAGSSSTTLDSSRPEIVVITNDTSVLKEKDVIGDESNLTENMGETAEREIDIAAPHEHERDTSHDSEVRFIGINYIPTVKEEDEMVEEKGDLGAAMLHRADVHPLKLDARPSSVKPWEHQTKAGGMDWKSKSATQDSSFERQQQLWVSQTTRMKI